MVIFDETLLASDEFVTKYSYVDGSRTVNNYKRIVNKTFPTGKYTPFSAFTKFIAKNSQSFGATNQYHYFLFIIRFSSGTCMIIKVCFRDLTSGALYIYSQIGEITDGDAEYSASYTVTKSVDTLVNGNTTNSQWEEKGVWLRMDAKIVSNALNVRFGYSLNNSATGKTEPTWTYGTGVALTGTEDHNWLPGDSVDSFEVYDMRTVEDANCPKMDMYIDFAQVKFDTTGAW